MRLTCTRLRGQRGFSLVDMLAAVAVIATVSAMATPTLLNAIDQYRLGMTTRAVERELQFAKLKAVSAETQMRIRFNCPVVGEYRVVELIGTPTNPDPNDADTYLTRCNDAVYPYNPTGADASRLTKPNNDGVLRTVNQGVTFTASQTIEFWPDGTVHFPGGNGVAGANIGNPGVTFTLSKNGKTKNIVVSGFGKIQMDR